MIAALAAMIGAVCGAPAAQAQLKPYKVWLGGDELLAPLGGDWVGRERTIADGELLFRIPSASPKGAVPAAEVSLEIGGLTFSAPARVGLIAPETATGGDLATLPQGAQLYCQPREIGRRRKAPRVKIKGVLRERFDEDTQLCLVDSDADSRFDKAFLQGTIIASDRRMFDIPPVPYAAVEHLRSDGNFVDVTFESGGLVAPPRFKTQLILGGNLIDHAWVDFEDPVTRKWHAIWRFDSDALPQQLRIGAAVITVLAFDRSRGTVTVRYDRAFTATPFRSVLASGYVLIER